LIINNKVIPSAFGFESFVYIPLKQPKFIVAIKKNLIDLFYKHLYGMDSTLVRNALSIVSYIDLHSCYTFCTVVECIAI
jgi:hypothetical protein